MEPRNELKARARELEYGNKPQEALGLYLQLMERSDQASPAIWTRAGEIQLATGEAEQGVATLTRAIAAFEEAGQVNVAIAIGQRIIQAGAATTQLHRRLGELALGQGYRKYASESIANYGRSAAGTGKLEDAEHLVTAFLLRFPNEQDLWRDLAEELLGHGREDEAIGLLERLSQAIADQGHADAAARIRSELNRLRRPGGPQEDASAQYQSATGADGADEGGASERRDELNDDTSLPLLDTAPHVERNNWKEDQGEASGVAPIEGLQTTHSEAWDLGSERDEVDDDGADPLPLLGSQPIVDPEPEIELEPRLDAEPLPFLEPTQADAPGGEGEDESDSDAQIIRAAVADLLSLSTPEVAPAEDASTHYDLGLAFKEMGLADEAIGHLAAALERGHEPISTLEVVGEILVGKGEYALVQRLLGRLGSDRSGVPELIGIHYWLGRSEEELGELDRARRCYEAVTEIEPDFRDAAERRIRLSASL